MSASGRGGLAAFQRWIESAGRWRALGLAFLAGVAMTAGQPPVSFPWAIFVAIPVLVWLMVAAPGWGRAALIGWTAGFGYFVSGLHWIGHPFLVDPEAFAWLLPFAVTLLPAGLGLFWALAFGLAHRLTAGSVVLRAIGLAGFWVLAEYARSTILTGFPWALPGYVWSETPIAQLGALVGPHGMSFLTLGILPLILLGLADQRRMISLAAAGIFVAVWVWGTVRVPEAILVAEGAPVVRVVQPNAPQALKWSREYAPVFYRRLLEETAKEDPELGFPELVIWPETAVTFFPDEHPDRVAEIAAAANGAHVITGALSRRQSPNGVALTNGLMEIRPDGTIGIRYGKHHLVPFGEYMPFPKLMAAIGLRQLAEQGGFQPGPGPQRLEVEGFPDFVPLICYEMIFPDGILPPGPRPDWILQVTNDAWFGNFAGPQQHLMQARMRAIETGLPVVRAANTGISAIIDPYGRLVKAIKLGDHGNVSTRLPSPILATVYVRVGDLIGVALAIIALLAGVRGRYLRRLV